MDNSKQSILPLYTVDAFTNKAFSGNGAAVCLLPYHFEIPDDLKQKMAAEINLSETAFISILQENDTFQNGRRFGLRWFTPTCEVPLCGHATLASAAVLFAALENVCSVVEFETISGTLKAERLSDGKIHLDLPAYASKHVDMEEYEDVVKLAVGSLAVEEVVLSSSGKLVVRLQDLVTRRALEELKPRTCDMLSARPDLRGLILTLKGAEDQPYDFVSRYFAPWMGVPEDPVTGSAHCALAPYWSSILKKKELFARQCSPRGGDLNLRVTSEDRVGVAGHAVIVVRGHIHF